MPEEQKQNKNKIQSESPVVPAPAKNISTRESITDNTDKKLDLKEALLSIWYIWRQKPICATFIPVLVQFAIFFIIGIIGLLSMTIMMPLLFAQQAVLAVIAIIVWSIVTILIGSWFGVFEAKFFLRLVRDGQCQVWEDMRKSFNFSLLVKYLFAIFLYIIIVIGLPFLVGIIGVILGYTLSNNIAIYILAGILAFILLFVPGVIWAIKFGLAFWFIVDEKQSLSVIDAFKMSAQKTKGYKLQIFVITLVISIILIFVGMLVGNFIPLAFNMLLMAYIYSRLSEGKITKPSSQYSQVAVIGVIVVSIILHWLSNMYPTVQNMLTNNINLNF